MIKVAACRGAWLLTLFRRMWRPKQMKIYTGTGDKGKTSLFSGERLKKSDPRIDAVGEMDELNAVIGAIKSAWQISDAHLDREIDRIQAWLMNAGAWLATTPGSDSASFLPPFTGEPAAYLESAIDRMSDQLPELKAFVLPQGHLSASFAHIARTVCRRVERRVIAFSAEADQGRPMTKTLSHILVFIGRLSDYLFVMARYLNQSHGIEDRLWKG